MNCIWQMKERTCQERALLLGNGTCEAPPLLTTLSQGGEGELPFKGLSELSTIFNYFCNKCFKEVNITSLVVQGLRICLLTQVMWVRSLVREDPTCCGSN